MSAIEEEHRDVMCQISSLYGVLEQSWSRKKTQCCWCQLRYVIVSGTS